MGGGSVFRVGDEVDLGQMLVDFTVLALGLVVFEKALHALEHRAERYPKYHEMINKVYRELMILGLIGLAIKLLKELKVVDDSSASMAAFLSADLAIFLMAVALIVQAICIFLQLREKNKQVDVLELFTSEDLFQLASSHERHRRVEPNPIKRAWTATRYDELMAMRMMRYLFLKTHSLPELFPFAKYLRQAQDNQITHMIDVEPTTWLLVFLIAWLWYSSVTLVANSGLLGNIHKHSDHKHDDRRLGDDDSSDDSSDVNMETMRAALTTVFIVFAWLLVLAHILTALYLQWCRRRVLRFAGIESRAQMLSRLKQIAVEEATHLATEVTSDAIHRMQKVEEEQQLEQHKNRHGHGHSHDVGLNLIKSCFRSIFHRGKEHGSHASATTGPRLRTVPEPTEGEEDHHDEHRATTVLLNLPYFSRSAWHFTIMLLLILNGLYTAFLLQIMMQHMKDLTVDFGWFVATMVPMPIVLNVVIQTHIIHDFVLVSSICIVDVGTLSDVIEHFIEIVELQTSFISEVRQCLIAKSKTIMQLEELLEKSDPKKTGWIDVEELRQALGSIGYHMSFFRFNSVMKLLFELRQIKVDYRKIIILLTLAEEHIHDAADDMHEIPLLESKASFTASSIAVLHQRRRSVESSVDLSQSRVLVRPTLHDALTKSSKLTQQLLTTNLHWRSSHQHRQTQSSRTSSQFLMDETSGRGHWGISIDGAPLSSIHSSPREDDAEYTRVCDV